MRAHSLLPAALCLLALRPAPASASPATGAVTTDATDALLVLRAACAADDPSVFSVTRLRQYAESVGRVHILNHQIRILGYNETCGPDWRSTVTRRTLSALGDGASVHLGGWVGSATCAALEAASRALQRPRPAPCYGQRARAAGVRQLAGALRWRRALVPPAPPRSECAAALADIRRELLSAGVIVHSALSTDEVFRQPQVVIMCASLRAEVEAAQAMAGVGAGAGVLLLQVEELEPSIAPSFAPPTPTTPPAVRHKRAIPKSNITLDIRKSPYERKIENLSPSPAVPHPDKANLSLFYPELNKKSFPSPATAASVNNVATPYRNKGTLYGVETPQPLTSKNVFRDKQAINTIKTDNAYYYVRNNSSLMTIVITASRPSESKNNIKAEKQKLPFRNRRDHSTSDNIHSTVFNNLEKISSLFDLQYRLLFLSSNRLDINHTKPAMVDRIYDEILDKIDLKTKKYKENEIRTPFFLYERTQVNSEWNWRLIAELTTTFITSADDSEEWTTTLEVMNATLNFSIWNEEQMTSEYEDVASSVTVPVLVACLAAALAAAGALALGMRWVAARRRRRRRRGDAVLAPTDFTFPADERRRVGEGMETMLSCWLQQLHEFGGPELERPDLLKQPPRVPAHAPSAPSSTCSINRVALDRRTRYKGDAVYMKYLPVTIPVELKRKATDVLLVMQSLRHENLNPFIGCLCEVRPALVFDHCGRGSLEDVLMADEIKLDWTFRLSLLTDLVKGMRYLHASPLRAHGRLSSRNCVVDSRWVLRVTDYGLPAFYRAHGLPQPPTISARELLWTAPELLREARGAWRGTPAGDVFSFAIVMQEVIVRGEPYCMLALTPEEIVEKVSHPPPLIRPSVSMGAAPPEAVSVMRQCWSEAPDLRPDFNRLHDIFRHLHKGRKINIVDSMFEMLEKYSNNLEELIRERTEQLDMEKKKTEQLLNRMLPRSVAERLMLGSRVEPEEFEEVSIYFSDIVGFTALAARSTPVQVVDLLNDLYTTFDAAIEQYRVYKVETIGDAYMVVGGLPARTRDHAESVATMALHLLHLAGRFRVRHLPGVPLRLRIGLHTGPCCAGVVGLTMPRYCLFGDTVNTASRMESTGAAWRIQVSAATAERLTAAGGYRLRSRGLTQIKGKGAMHTYWLLGKDGFDKPLPTPPPLESEEVLFETDAENDSEASASLPPASPPPAHQPHPSATTIERQRSDPLSTPDKYAWQRSGAVSADSSPPRTPRAPPGGAALDHSAPYSRYRCLSSGGGARVLRRQWSLERGDVLAAAAGARSDPEPAPPAAPAAPPAALLPAPRAPPAAPRYRTRPDPDPPPLAPALSPPPPPQPDEDPPRARF